MIYCYENTLFNSVVLVHKLLRKRIHGHEPRSILILLQMADRKESIALSIFELAESLHTKIEPSLAPMEAA